MKTGRLFSLTKDERGVAAIVVALGLFMLLGFGALAIDLSHIYVARNELKNATDAGALAGARFLYNREDGTVDTGANQRACDAARDNRSENVVVEVNCGQTADGVERGHWSFSTRVFTRSNSTAPVDLWNRSWAELDADPNFINAVRVTARREATQIASYFATLFGYTGFRQSRDAVAYIGFAGTLEPQDVDQPIALCKQALLQTGEYTCSIGRMINSGSNVESHETGGWTDFNQDNPCQGGTNARDVRDLVCGSGNPRPIILGQDMATNGGAIQTAFSRLMTCWQNTTGRTQPWTLTLPVIDCPDNNVGTCERVVGAVTVNIVWINDRTDPHYNNAPTEMAAVPTGYGAWSSSDPSGQNRWNSFVAHFHLQNVDGTPAPYGPPSIYFLPDCTPHEPRGVTGGDNFGILAEIPVLVQ